MLDEVHVLLLQAELSHKIKLPVKKCSEKVLVEVITRTMKGAKNRDSGTLMSKFITRFAPSTPVPTPMPKRAELIYKILKAGLKDPETKTKA